MTEEESRAYLESVWESVDLSPYQGTKYFAVRVGGRCFVNFDAGGAASLTQAVTYTKKLLAEIAEGEEEIELLDSDVENDALGMGYVYMRILASIERVLTEKRAWMKEGK